jgi:hypothetical protein
MHRRLDDHSHLEHQRYVVGHNQSPALVTPRRPAATRGATSQRPTRRHAPPRRWSAPAGHRDLHSAWTGFALPDLRADCRANAMPSDYKLRRSRSGALSANPSQSSHRASPYRPRRVLGEISQPGTGAVLTPPLAAIPNRIDVTQAATAFCGPYDASMRARAAGCSVQSELGDTIWRHKHG